MQNPQLTESIRTFLQQKELSQTDFAKKAGLSVQYVNDLYLGKAGSRISGMTERKLKRVMGKSLRISLPGDSVNTQIS
jgi:transcriptional regulator with XRE-family HTH domain